MYWYQLERDASDLFMKNEEVDCRVAAKSAWDISSGDFVMIRLANGKKYKAVVRKISLFSFKDGFVGEMTVKKTHTT
ncbi:hypothetical protein DQQ10_20430 [Pseudochryseolinea flava]|uniref:Uncharacterized protein n=2 Tax=Pseudochryseolinea flava TaxID=2059302 RepID=A0A364XZQ3_9BACT|nr:hypothetical protein DQQ10_20430 [Pseudochryseolinea flava]